MEFMNKCVFLLPLVIMNAQVCGIVIPDWDGREHYTAASIHQLEKPNQFKILINFLVPYVSKCDSDQNNELCYI